MTGSSPYPVLQDLEFIPYLNEEGVIPTLSQGKIGVYGIFDQDQTLQMVGYSRDIFLSLQQHLVRKPESCYWVKVYTIDRPSRAVLEETRQQWLEENGTIPNGNGVEADLWQKPIDIKPLLTAQEQEEFQKLEAIAQIKLLKKVARRVETEIKQKLEQRGVKMSFRFNPKLKEKGILDLK